MTWPLFRRDAVEPHDEIAKLPEPPSWRAFGTASTVASGKPRGASYQISEQEEELVNAALYLRRPLLITGKPGVGKSSLAYAVAHQLNLGEVLEWRITTRSTLAEGLYAYDAIGRLEAANLLRLRGGEKGQVDLPDIGAYLRLGPLGTALHGGSPLRDRPRVLLIDEIDKSDVDLPNNLLHIFEEGSFDIPELMRIAKDGKPVQVLDWYGQSVEVTGGRVRTSAQSFPFVIFTSNGERDFPPAFLRRCLRLYIQPPEKEALQRIVGSHFEAFLRDRPEHLAAVEAVIDEFLRLRREDNRELATDQLLNAVYLVAAGIDPEQRPTTTLRESVLRSLASQ